MSEPTQEQIKEAFNKTIERWEKIVIEPAFYRQSQCTLCQMEGDDSGAYVCSKSCPIRLYTGNSACYDSPYHTFYKDKTPANALAELNFLRKVYIWWMEGEANKIFDKWGTGVVRARKEEKKEEWVDVTEEVDWRLHKSGGTFWVRGYYKGTHIVWLDSNGINKQGQQLHEIKIEEEGMCFRILKKA